MSRAAQPEHRIVPTAAAKDLTCSATIVSQLVPDEGGGCSPAPRPAGRHLRGRRRGREARRAVSANPHRCSPTASLLRRRGRCHAPAPATVRQPICSPLCSSFGLTGVRPRRWDEPRRGVPTSSPSTVAVQEGADDDSSAGKNGQPQADPQSRSPLSPLGRDFSGRRCAAAPARGPPPRQRDLTQNFAR